MPLPEPSPSRHRDAAPTSVRWAGRIVVGVLLAGALYLIAVRHEAILADLAAVAAWCF